MSSKIQGDNWPVWQGGRGLGLIGALGAQRIPTWTQGWQQYESCASAICGMWIAALTIMNVLNRKKTLSEANRLTWKQQQTRLLLSNCQWNQQCICITNQFSTTFYILLSQQTCLITFFCLLTIRSLEFLNWHNRHPTHCLIINELSYFIGWDSSLST